MWDIWVLNIKVLLQSQILLHLLVFVCFGWSTRFLFLRGFRKPRSCEVWTCLMAFLRFMSDWVYDCSLIGHLINMQGLLFCFYRNEGWFDLSNALVIHNNVELLLRHFFGCFTGPLLSVRHWPVRVWLLINILVVAFGAHISTVRDGLIRVD